MIHTPPQAHFFFPLSLSFSVNVALSRVLSLPRTAAGRGGGDTLSAAACCPSYLVTEGGLGGLLLGDPAEVQYSKALPPVEAL